MGLPVKNLRDGVIKVQVSNDGGGNPGEVEVKLEEGNLTWSENRPVEMISDRGTLDHARKAAQDQLLELTFSVMYQTHLDPNSADVMLYEALTRQGGAAGWISQSGSDSDDYSVNIEFTIADPAGGTDEVINFEKFNVTSEEFAEGDPNTLTITGTAPLYWPDFWWTARDGLSPHIGGHGVFTRASAATFINSDGEVDYARSGEFRSAHFPSLTAGRTGLLEDQRSNIATMSEELGGADWAATNVTVADDAVASPDAFTTAETLTASAGNGTLINDLGALGAVDYVFSIWLKRKTGTGDIDLTLDNGASWTTVTVTSSWALFEITQSLANPDAGIRIVTNADAVWAWGGQVEAAAFASSYIPTTVYPLSPDGFLEFSGSAGNYASTPDHNRLDIIGDIDVRARVAPDDWTPAGTETFLAKWTGAGDERSYNFELQADGTLRFGWSTDGIDSPAEVSSVATGFTDGTIHWVRVTLDVSSGDVNFYTGDDGENWTQLGSTQTSGATSINAGIAVLEFGSLNVGTSQNLAGKVYRAQVYDGIVGTLVFDADPQDLSTHAATRITLTEKENSAVVTTFATSSAATRVTDLLFFPIPLVVSTPQEATAYLDFVEKGGVLSGNGTGLIYIGSDTDGADPRWVIDVSGGFYETVFDNGTVSQVATLGAAPSIDDRVEIRDVLGKTATLILDQSVNGAAVTTATDATTAAIPAAYADTRLYVNSSAEASKGFNAFRELILTRRTRTLEHLRKVG